MISLKIKKRKKKILYEKFKQDKEDKLKKNEDAKESILESKKGEKKKEKRPKLQYLNQCIMISICTLEKSIGCTHFAKSLAYYISNVIKKDVCIIDMKGELLVSEINEIPVYPRTEIYEMYNKYQYVILDVGIMNEEYLKEVMFSQVKILIAILDDEYLHKLYNFIKNEEDKKIWKYIFNHVPNSKKGKVYELMEDYEHWCMPVCDGKSFDKETKKVLKKLAYGEMI